MTIYCLLWCGYLVADGARGRRLIRGMALTRRRWEGSVSNAGFVRYNMTYITRQAALNGKPILGVSINYRLAAFGFLNSEEVQVCLC